MTIQSPHALSYRLYSEICWALAELKCRFGRKARKQHNAAARLFTIVVRGMPTKKQFDFLSELPARCLIAHSEKDSQWQDDAPRLKSRSNRFQVISAEMGVAQALQATETPYLIFCESGDIFRGDFFLQLSSLLATLPEIDFVYFDEEIRFENGRHFRPALKPAWSPELASHTDYISGTYMVSRTACARACEIWEQQSQGAPNFQQRHWQWLAIAKQSRVVKHIPKILIRGKTESRMRWTFDGRADTPRPARKPAAKGQIQAGSKPTASIIIPTRDGLHYLSACITSIREVTTSESAYEIIVIDNGSTDPATLSYLTEANKKGLAKVIRADMDFNWSRLNNIGARAARGETSIFLNNDTEVISPDWLDHLTYYSQMPEIGAVGAQLLFADGTIQHAGVVLGMGGWADHIYRTAAPSSAESSIFVPPTVTRNSLAVTGACLAIETRKFFDLGGFDEDFLICGSDIELCLRAHAKGLRNVYCAEALLLHHESKTRNPTKVPLNDFLQSDLKYRPYRLGVPDPYFNPNLSLTHTTPQLASQKERRDYKRRNPQWFTAR